MTSGLIEILRENSALATAVGSYDGRVKIFPSTAPQASEAKSFGPYIIVAETSLNPSLGKGCAYDWDKPRYDVLAFSLSFRQAETLQQLCRAAVDTGSGFETSAGATFEQIYMVDRRDLSMQAVGQDSVMYCKVGVYEASVRLT